MSGYRVYERKHKRKEQCGSVPRTPEKPTAGVPEIKEVYARRSRMKLEEKVSESCSSEKKIDCDKTFDSFFNLVPLAEKDAVFDSCMPLSDKEKEQSSNRTESISLGSVGKIDSKMSLDSLGMGDLLNAGEGKEQNFCPGRNFDGIEDLYLESTVCTVTSKQKEDGFNGIEGTFSGHGDSIDLDKSTYTLENSGGFNHQTDELDSTSLASAGAIDGSNILEKDWDSVLSDNHFMELPCLLEPKVSQPYALSQDNGFMRETVTFDQILVNDCLDLKQSRQKPKRKIHRPKVAFDGKPNTLKLATPKQVREKKPRLATPKLVKEKKPKLVAAKWAKRKKSENVRKQASPGLNEAIIENKNLSDIKSNMIIEINETQAAVARALDFQSESLDAKPVDYARALDFPLENLDAKPVEFAFHSFPKKRRSERRWTLKKSKMIIEINETKAAFTRTLCFQSEPVESASHSVTNKKRRSRRRRILSFFSLPIMSVTKSVKNSKKKLFTAKWLPRRKRTPRKRPRKVTEVEGKSNAALYIDNLAVGNLTVTDKDLSAVMEIEVLESDTPVAGTGDFYVTDRMDLDLSAMREIKVLETYAPITGTDNLCVIDQTVGEIEEWETDALITGKNNLRVTDKMDISAVREIEVLETDTPITGTDNLCVTGKMDLSAMREIKVLETDILITGKRKRKASTPGAIVKPRGQSGLLSKKYINFIIQKLQSFRISDDTLVPYQGPFQPLKKIRPLVVLDPETVRVWNLLMGIDVERIKNEASEEKEKWWQKEREVFAGRVASFIARMQQIQGDRGFRKWKGSVLDSAIGVLLTQNVTDHCSSNAFMCLAAKFPPKQAASGSDPCLSQESVGSNTAEYDAEGNQYFVIEPEPERNKEFKEPTDGLIGEFQETSIDTGCEGCLRVISNTNLPTIPEADHNGGLVGELEETSMNAGQKGCLQVVSDTNLPENSIANPNGSCGPMVQRQYAKMQKRVLSKIPKLKEREYLNMGFGKRKSTSEKKESASKEEEIDWESIRLKYSTGERSSDQMDTVDWEAVRLADVKDLADCIKERGQQNRISETIQNLLNRVVSLHNCLDLEWLRDTPPDLAKRYLLEVNGLGLKSVECIRLLSLEQVAFPVDVNVARIAVRLGWVPLQPLPEQLQLHLLEQYPIMDNIQIYLWPRLCNLPQRILYKLHFHMITFGKVTCTKSKPNCNACPMRDNCKHFQSEYASSKKAIPSDKMKSSAASNSSPRALKEAKHILDSKSQIKIHESIIEEPFEPPQFFNSESQTKIYELPQYLLNSESQTKIYEAIIEEHSRSPSKYKALESLELEYQEPEIEPIIKEPEYQQADIEPIIEEPLELSSKYKVPESQEPEIEYDSDGIPIFRISIMKNNFMFRDGEVSNSLVSLDPNATSAPKLKQNRRLRTEHLVYELPRNHVLLEGLEQTESDNDLQYHLAIWRSGEIAESSEPPKKRCNSTGPDLCNEETCFSCNNIREINANIVRGTLLIPYRVANKGSFPLNGTYFQVNEVFADHETSYRPIKVSRELIYNLRTRTAYFGTSISAILRGESMYNIQKCFWTGIICNRGFERGQGIPRPLASRFHCGPSKIEKVKRNLNPKQNC
ncbi:DNA glycosylase/AP lyase ROS1-like isoform X1 [Gossypium arboreum]|uniref:DNA glycosylase/AP lyase ROS1-like isoform X1 n=2 Tax=Gossypium arboreum TaxID=29729 RepID=UPI0022F1A02A|nr:DNA glycosylase/AP lyase ROS1-like isoform X1 [Gossypium arboreum]